MQCFAVTAGNISILNYIYHLGFKLHEMAHILKVLELIKSCKCVLTKILLIVVIIMIFALISLLILRISDGIEFFLFKTDGINVELSVFAAVVVMTVMYQDSSGIFNDKWVNKKNSVNFVYDKARRILFCDNNDYLNEFNDGSIFLFNFQIVNIQSVLVILIIVNSVWYYFLKVNLVKMERLMFYAIEDDISIYSIITIKI